MKRLMALVLVLMLAASAAYAENAGMSFSIYGGVKGKANVASRVIPIRSGPGYMYDNIDQDLVYFNEGAGITVLTQVRVSGETWIQAEVSSNRGKIRCYMVASSGGNTYISYPTGSVPWEVHPDNLRSEWACMSYDSIAYRYGPGGQYPYTGLFLSPRDYAFVILTEGDWALVEATNRFDDGVYSGFWAHRGWVRQDELIY